MSNTNQPLKLGPETVSGFMKPNIKINQFLTGTILPVCQHLAQILPEAVFVFLILFSILTQNFANGILALSLVESLFVFSIIGNAAQYFTGSDSPTTKPEACQAGFPRSISSYSTLSIFNKLTEHLPFPSHSIAVISTLIGYLLGALFQFKGELRQLGPEWEARIPIAVTLSFLVLTAFVLFRYIAGCEGLGIIIGTLLTGIVLGTLILYQNMALMGKEAVNILGVPTLESRTIAGKPLYVCNKAE
jgi:hypothetical protein